MLTLVTLALAAPPDLRKDDSVARALSGDCAGAEPDLRRRVDYYPDDLGARIVHDACRYGGTEKGAAQSDLESLYRVTSPYDPGQLLKSRDAKPADVERLRREAQLAVESLVRLMVEKKSFEEARHALAELSPQVGASGPTVAAELLVERSQNGVKVVWPMVRTALAAFPEDTDVLEEIARVVFDDGAAAPPEVLDALFARGGTTAKLNALLGLVRAARPADCLHRADTFHVPAADADRLRAIVYRCAVAAPDLPRADGLLGTPGLDPTTMAAHARLRMDAGQLEQAIALAEPVTATNRAAQGVVLEAWARQGNTAAIERFAATLPKDSPVRLAAATSLVQGHQPGPALLLVEGTCANYAGSDTTTCERIVSAAHRALGR